MSVLRDKLRYGHINSHLFRSSGKDPRGPLFARPGERRRAASISGTVAAILALGWTWSLSGCGHPDHETEHRHGVVDFPISCTDRAREEFETGLGHLHHMMYAYLQMGEKEKARETLKRVREIDELWAASFAGYNTAAPQARYFLEQRKWEEAAQLEPKTPDVIRWEEFPAAEALFFYARGLGAARSGDLEAAAAERDRIGERVQVLRDEEDHYWAYMTEALGKARWTRGSSTNGARRKGPWRS